MNFANTCLALGGVRGAESSVNLDHRFRQSRVALGVFELKVGLARGVGVTGIACLACAYRPNPSKYHIIEEGELSLVV